MEVRCDYAETGTADMKTSIGDGRWFDVYTARLGRPQPTSQLWPPTCFCK